MEHPPSDPIAPIATDGAPTPEIVAQAADWLAHLGSGDADAADRERFEAWRAAHPAHALAVDRLGGLDDRLRGTGGIEREALHRLFLRPRRRAGGALLGLVALGGAGWLAATDPTVRLHFADTRTAVGETRAVPLADGSRIVLASDSAADDDIGRDRRTVALIRGELFAEVATDDRVPFTVTTGDGTAEALGTAFTVRKEADATIVAVASSHVRACPAAGDAARCVLLGPGERARLAAGQASRLATVPPEDVAAWTEGWLPVEDQPLDTVLDSLNRWREAPVRFDRATLAGLRVSGVLPLRDTDRALDNLVRSQPIAIDRSDPAHPLIRRTR